MGPVAPASPSRHVTLFVSAADRWALISGRNLSGEPDFMNDEVRSREETVAACRSRQS